MSRCNQRATLQLKLSQRELAAAVAEAAERECAQLPDMAIVAIEAGLVGSMTCAPTKADCLATSEKYAGRGMNNLGEPVNCSIGQVQLRLVGAVAVVSSQGRRTVSVASAISGTIWIRSYSIQADETCTYGAESGWRLAPKA